MSVKSKIFADVALDNMSQGVVVYDEDLIVIGFNRRALEILNIPSGEVSVGESFAKWVRYVVEHSGDDSERTFEERYEDRIAIAKSFAPYSANKKQIDDKIIEVSGKPVPGVGYVTTYTDVTERKLAEKVARESERRFKDFAEIGSDWFWEMGPDLKFTYHSSRYFEITGFRPEDKIGTTRTQYVDPNGFAVESEKWTAHLADLAARRSFKNFEYEFKGLDGRIIHARISGAPVFGDTGKFLGYRGTGTDITNIVQNAKALRDNEERFRALIDNLPSFINLKDQDGRYQLINQKHSEIFGFEEQQIVGKVISEFLPGMQSDDALAQERTVLESRTAVTHERKLVVDNQVKEFLVTKFPIFDGSGEIAGLGTIGTDITQLKQAQVALMAAKIEAEAANRSKSKFLAAMSHDLRTPLNAIIGFADAICLQYFGEINEKYQEYANDIRWSGEHLLSLIGDILDLSSIEAGKQVLNKQEIPFVVVVMECEKIIKGEARTLGVELLIDVPDDLPSVYADRRAMKKILLNLLSNSVKFTPQGGTVTLALAVCENHHVLTISDTGIGIAEDKIATITDPFVRGVNDPYTSQEGVGLGLSIVQSLVDLHEGTLDITSDAGEGTTVTVTFPIR